MIYVDAPGIASGKLEDRRYQAEMAKWCMRENTLVILPTGLGKTAVAARVAANVLSRGKKVLIMAPTKPLVDQHQEYFSNVLPSFSIGMLNGNMSPEKRTDIVSASQLVISTPQCIANDLESERYGLSGFGLVVFDEAHKATGNYAYVTVAQYVELNTYVIGMTASPGSDLVKIEEVCHNLRISRVDVRSEHDPDVSPYVHDTYNNRIVVNMPKDLTNISNLFKEMLDLYFGELVHMKMTVNPHWPASTKHMLAVGQTLQLRLARGEKSDYLFRGMTVQAICIKILKAINYTETQGMSALRTFLRKINESAEAEKAPRADRELVAQENYKKIWHMVSESRIEHPKISRIMSLVSKILNEEKGIRIIVFTQYRETCNVVAEKLSAVPSAKVCKLIGHANGGQKQKEQLDTLDDFRNGIYNVVVATSVGEEGLDIASTNAVIFYEPVPSEIRTIQRRGRTGRKNDGEVYMLVAAGTMDETVDHISRKKEADMREKLEALSRTLSRDRVLPRTQSVFDP